MKLKSFFFYTALSVAALGLPLEGLDQFPTAEEASFYHYHSQQQWEIAFEALKHFQFQGNEQVLDVGCGSGKISANIAGRVPKGFVLGLDISQGMIAFAHHAYTPFYSNLSFTHDDILTFDSVTQYDLIFSSSSLHWILDHNLFLTKVYDALKDGGRILFTIPCASLPEVSAVFQDITAQEPWNEYLKEYYHPRRKFTPEEYTLLLTQAGFSEIEVVQVPCTYYFETKREYADWYAAFSPMLFYIPSEFHEAFLKSTLDRYLKSFPLDETGRVVFKQNELIIKARK